MFLETKFHSLENMWVRNPYDFECSKNLNVKASLTCTLYLFVVLKAGKEKLYLYTYKLHI